MKINGKNGFSVPVPNSMLIIGHGIEHPTMHYFGNPRHTPSIIAYMILTVFLEIPVKNWIVGILLTCPIT